MMKSNVLALACILVFGVGSAFAGTATGTILVSATVNPTCTITTSPLAFNGYYTATVGATTTTAPLSYTCTNGFVTTITLDQGLHPLAGSTGLLPLRQMADSGGTNFLAYSITQDLLGTQAWGDAPGVPPGGSAAPATGTGAQVSLTVYGSIAQGLNPPSGQYTDTVTATITF
jgi:spore coat protein U-like protein